MVEDIGEEIGQHLLDVLFIGFDFHWVIEIELNSIGNNQQVEINLFEFRECVLWQLLIDVIILLILL